MKNETKRNEENSDIETLTIAEFDAIPSSGGMKWNTDAILKDFEKVKRNLTETSLIGISYNCFKNKYASKRLKHIDKDVVCGILQYLLNVKDSDIIKDKLCVYVRVRV